MYYLLTVKKKRCISTITLDAALLRAHLKLKSETASCNFRDRLAQINEYFASRGSDVGKIVDWTMEDEDNIPFHKV